MLGGDFNSGKRDEKTNLCDGTAGICVGLDWEQHRKKGWDCAVFTPQLPLVEDNWYLYTSGESYACRSSLCL